MDQNLIAISHNDCLARHSAHGSELIKQFSGSGLEVTRVRFSQGESFSLNPPSGAGAIKIYTITAGEIYCMETRQDYMAGSSFVLQAHHEIVSLTAKSPGELIIHAVGGETFQTSADVFQKVHQTMLAIQAKDEYTYNHCINVYRLARMMVEPLGYTGRRVRNLLWAARYHDIGKISIDDRILNKPGRLEAEEFAIMQGHVEAGRPLLDEHFGEETYRIVAQHHERLDGSGYPLGLRGEEILEEARLLAICDAYDAMTSDRVYKQARTMDEARAELISLADRHFDRRLLELFFSTMETAHQATS